ncbi:MAG: hypothetical protein Q4D02_04130 [Clostridia bacterium]|nr:hypothetical protein [Clostridia bacterium]
MDKLITEYVLEDEMLIYDDGHNNWKAKFYFSPQRKEFRIYGISSNNLTEEEISVILNEFLTYHYYISYHFIPNDIAIEDFVFLINGYNVSKKGYDMLTYYITEMSAPFNEAESLKRVREAFYQIMENIEKLGKEPIIIKFHGNRLSFLNFYMDLIHVIDQYEDFPDGISIVYDYKKRILNHEFYLLPVI